MDQPARIVYLLGQLRQGRCTPDELAALKRLLSEDGAPEIEQFLMEALEQQSDARIPERSDALWKMIDWQLQAGQARFNNNAIRRYMPFLAVAVAAGLVLLFYARFASFQGLSHPAGFSMVTIQADLNVSKSVQLPDGSTVWLNKGSQIRYQQPFKDTLREIRLVGEAFFKVTKDPSRPFIVWAKSLKTQVLGTEFNVRAYALDSLVSVALAEGSVRVETPGMHPSAQQITLLSPYEQMEYMESSKRINKSAFKGNLPYAWKETLILFEGATVQEVTRVLMEKYGVQIIIPRGFRTDSRLVHRFDAEKRSIQEVLEGISKVTNYHFEKTNENEYEYVVQQD